MSYRGTPYTAITSFVDNCIEGIEPNHERIKFLMDQSLMLVTALNPHIGYDKAAIIAKKAYREGLSLKEAAIQLNFISEQDFDKFVVPEHMVGKI